MSSAKVHVVVTDHERKNVVYRSAGVEEEVFRFSAYVVGNPAVKANGPTEEAVLAFIRNVLMHGSGGKRKIVEMDIGDLVTVQDVMGS